MSEWQPPEPYESRLAIEAEAFETWLMSAPAGARIIYHEGLLMRDRKWCAADRSPPWIAQGIDRLADVVLFAAERGLVTLTQHRLTDERYDYRARRTAAPVRETKRRAREEALT